MSRIDTTVNSIAIVEWMQKNQEQIKTHPSWHYGITESDSEMLLKHKSAFTYLVTIHPP